ncbi:MAG: hypothetical protein L3J65_00375 [Robiginitomaculum sp.]|nr:hypothetical protein [Robiginitomaculum sp.]
MKRILFLAFTTFLLITLTACGGKKGTSDNLLVGTWVASEPTTVTESGMTITFSDMTSTYSKDNTAKASGNMSMSGAGLPVKLDMTIATESTWSVEGNTLSETITDADIKMKTNIPGMPDMGGMIAQQMKSQAGTSTIVKLDKKTLILKEDKTGVQVTMKRK